MEVVTNNFKSFFENVTKIKYFNHKMSYLTAPGENYGSIMLKIDVECIEKGVRKVLPLVVKLAPNNELLKSAFLSDVTFKKEILAYTNVLETIKDVEEEYEILKPLKVFAKCYGAVMKINGGNDNPVLILENLKCQGFNIEDRFLGFDLEQSELILKNLAQLHASVIAVRLHAFKKFEENILPALATINNGTVMLDGFSSTALHFAKTLTELEPHIHKLEAAINRAKAIGGLRFPKETNRKFYTFVHNDLWTNNIMVKKENQKTTEVRFVDFQLIQYGSALRDLVFFMFTSINWALIDEHFTHLIKHYHNNFIKCLDSFGCSLDGYSFEDFKKELNDVATYEFFHIIFMLKPVLSEKGSIENLEGICEDDFGRIDNIGQAYIDRLKYIVLTFAKNKWI